MQIEHAALTRIQKRAESITMIDAVKRAQDDAHLHWPITYSEVLKKQLQCTRRLIAASKNSINAQALQLEFALAYLEEVDEHMVAIAAQIQALDADNPFHSLYEEKYNEILVLQDQFARLILVMCAQAKGY